MLLVCVWTVAAASQGPGEVECAECAFATHGVCKHEQHGTQQRTRAAEPLHTKVV